MRKRTEKSVKNSLDRLIDQIVYLRDNDTCQRCGRKVAGCDRHGSHVIPVSLGNKLRWDENNMKVLCFYDHLRWWHKNPVEAGEWFMKKFPERWQYLQANRGIVQLRMVDLLEIEEKLKARLKELECGQPTIVGQRKSATGR